LKLWPAALPSSAAKSISPSVKAQKKLSQYGGYLAELRLQFKPKRNFIKLLDDVVRSMTFAKWPL